MQLRPLDQQTLVITGATSGIGLATALMAAERGASLLLVARDPDDLAAAAGRCREAGGPGTRVETVAADVADHATMDLVVERAKEAFGGFDTWVNNAGASVYGRLEDIPIEDARQVFETNYWGTVNGSLAAVGHFRERGPSSGNGMALINIGSVLSDRAIPLQGQYCATKHAVKGFTDALRMELEKDGVPVSVSLVKPSAVNTPYPEHAANYMPDAAPKLPEPAYEPEVVARTILTCAEKPVREVTVGAKDGVVAWASKVAPGLVDKAMEAAFFDQQKDYSGAGGPSRGALHEPQPGGARVRGMAQKTLAHSPYTQMALRPGLSALGIGAALGVATLALLRR